MIFLLLSLVGLLENLRRYDRLGNNAAKLTTGIQSQSTLGLLLGVERLEIFLQIDFPIECVGGRCHI